MSNLISNVLELRVDNLVLDKHNEIHRFTFMDFMNFRHPNMGGNYGFSSIPITEEWLLKFGFTFNKFDLNRFDDPNDGGNHYYIMPYKTNYVFRCAGCSLVEIKYVHQLKNLYFALTGTELELKP